MDGEDLQHLRWKKKYYEDILLRPLETPITGETYDRFIWMKIRYDAMIEIMETLKIT